MRPDGTGEPVPEHAAGDYAAEGPGSPLPGFDPHRPNIARVYDYLLGGKDNFPVDREEGEMLLGIYPQLQRRAMENRLFLGRAVHWLAAERGIRQFIDIGSGLPTTRNTHEIAQDANPACRVAYVDNDPMVLAHARAILADRPGVSAVAADAAAPAEILAHPDVASLNPSGEPCAVILAMVLHFFPLGTAARIVAGFTATIAPGSYLVISIGSGDSRVGGALAREYTPHRLYNHSQDQILSLFDGLDVIDPPGLADARDWQPGTPAPRPSRTGGHVLAAVARKPSLMDF
jgi:S-adenosyl methyltransferase